MSLNDLRLVEEFVKNDSQPAFAAIVERYIDFVYSAALRQVNGDSGLAADVTQGVFTDLARKAPLMRKDVLLAAWLHRATRLTALSALRARQRRIVREREAVRMREMERESENVDWNSISAVIDKALDELNERDREAVLLRYFQSQSFRDMSSTLRISEDAARMRVERALEKLRALLGKEGIASTGAALSAALTGQSALSAPAGLSLLVTQTAPSLVVNSALTSLTIMATTKLKLGIAAAISAGAIAIATREHFSKRELESELARLDAQTRSAPVNRSAVPDSATDFTERDELARLRAQQMELLRLRGEVGVLRKAKEEAEHQVAKVREQKEEKAEEPVDPEQEAYKTVAIARMNYARGWGVAFMMFAEENGGMMPKTFAHAAKHYPEEWASVMSAFDEGRFEIVFDGSLKDLSEPAKTIVVREKDPFSNPKRRGFARTYLFADGHTEIHSAPDGNFENWERERLVAPAGTQ